MWRDNAQDFSRVFRVSFSPCLGAPRRCEHTQDYSSRCCRPHAEVARAGMLSSYCLWELVHLSDLYTEATDTRVEHVQPRELAFVRACCHVHFILPQQTQRHDTKLPPRKTKCKEASMSWGSFDFFPWVSHDVFSTASHLRRGPSAP